MTGLLPTILALVAALLPLALPGRGPDELDTALARFRSALAGMDEGERNAALDALVGLGHAGATPSLTGEYARCATALHRAEEEVQKVEYALVQRERMLAMVRLRAERVEGDSSLEGLISDHEKGIAELQGKLGKERAKVAAEGPWRERLSDATERLFVALGSRRKGAEKAIWKDAEEHIDLAVRLASIEMLGRVGDTGTAVRIQKMMDDVAQERARIRRVLRKEELDVRELERRMQAELEQTGGRPSRGMAPHYNRVKAEAARLRTQLTLGGHLLDACVSSAAAALAREEATGQKRSIDALVRAYKKSKGDARLRTLGMLARVDTSGVRENLGELLDREKEPVAIAELLIDLAQLSDPGLVARIQEEGYLAHGSWHVQAAAVTALARLRVAEAIPILLARLESAEGRLRSDIRDGLIELTGQDFRTNLALWKRWWSDNGAGFVVPEEPPETSAHAEAKQGLGVTFFGITTESQRVLFVLDLSGSMKWSMVSHAAPGERTEGEPPREGEISRLTAAKGDLVKALGGLQEGAAFNLVLYATDVWSWVDKDVVEMKPETRSKALEFVDRLEAVGGTNIYGALATAFDIAGADDGGGEWSEPKVDTIFLLSDGQPSAGVSQDDEDILAMVRESNESAGIVVHTIGLSGDHNAHLMRRLAEENGGTYVAH